MRKLAILLTPILLLAMIIVSIGCGGEDATPTPTGGETTAPTPTAAPTPEPITLKLITSAVLNTARGAVYTRFEELVEEYTEGRVLIDMYPGSQLFPTTEEWEAVVTGAVDIMGDSSYYISPAVPSVMISYIDGLWESYDHAYAALEETELPQLMAEQLKKAAPVTLLGLLPGAMAGAVVNSVRETKTYADLEGLKCSGAPGSPVTPLYDYTGMSMIPISLEEVSAGFIQGLVDAVQYPPTAITGLGMEETAKHAIINPYAWFFMTAMVINDDSLARIAAEDQDIIFNRVMPEMYEISKKAYRDDEKASLEKIEQNVETFHVITAEEAALYGEYARNHSFTKVMKIMIDRSILDIIEETRPSAQQ